MPSMLDLLSPQDQAELRRASMMSFGTGMLGASGWSPTTTTMGAAFGQGAAGYANTRAQMLPGMLQGAQLQRAVARDEEEDAKKKELVASMSPGDWKDDGNNTYSRPGVDQGRFERALAALYPEKAAARLLPKEEEDYTLTPGAGRFRGGQQISAMPAAAGDAKPDFITLQKAGAEPVTLRTTDPKVQDYLVTGYTEVKTPAAQVNISSGSKYGNIPQGWMLEELPDGKTRMVPVPEGPAAREEIDRRRKAEAGAREREIQNDIVVQDIDRAMASIQGANFPVTGWGSVFAGLPGTPQGDLARTLETIKANVGFDKLQQMREMSPTGGALGQVSDFENRTLQAVKGNLEQSQSKEQLLRNLTRLRDLYAQVVHYGIPNPPQGVAPELWVAMTPEERALWQN